MTRHRPSATNESTDIETVLVVDDERDLADLYAMWLSDQYSTRTTYSGADAMRTFDTETVDAVILDRWMPEQSGDDVLDHIRSKQSDIPVVMVTAVDPDFDIIDLAFDDYLTKPTTCVEMLETLSTVATTTRFGSAYRELYTLEAKRGFLQARRTREELEVHSGYRELTARVDELTAATNPEEKAAFCDAIDSERLES